MNENNPSAELVRELLTYNPETGKLTWLPRPRAMFVNDGTFMNWQKNRAGKPAFTSKDTHGHLQGAIMGRLFSAHRVAWAIVYGEWPNGEIDHINGIRSDNSIANLRCVSHRENMRNTKMRNDNTSGKTGVIWHIRHKKWMAQIYTGRNNLNLGYYSCFDDAVLARKAAEIKLGFHKNHGRAEPQ